MLDDIKTIKKIDKSDALDVVAAQHAQLERVFDTDLSHLPRPKQIVLAGMGGSALAALVLKVWLGESLAVPFEIVRDYTLPGSVGSDTLVIASSYSGNTEETVSALADAEDRGAHIVVLSAGGKLGQTARDQNYAWLKLPSGLQPRYTTFYGLRALATICETLGVVPKRTLDQLQSAALEVASAAGDWVSGVPEAKNPAKQIARRLHEKTPVIYGGPLMKAAAYKWKISCNENAKTLAFWDEFSEFDHNEFMGWSSRPAGESFAVVELRSNLEHPEIIRRYDLSNQLLSGKMPTPIRIDCIGHTPLEQLLWAIQLGDFVSIYLAILSGIDPTPVTLIEELKRDLAKK